MNPGIFYLYEYSNTQKLRNTGFLKITRYYHSCTLQLHARGIPVSYADTIKLYVFYLENNLAKATVLTEITCANHALSVRMTSAESHLPDGRPLDKVDGFFLPLPNGHILAAAAPGITIDTQKLLSTSAEKTPESKETPPESTSDMEPDQDEITNIPSNEVEIINETSDTIESVNETPVTLEPVNEPPITLEPVNEVPITLEPVNESPITLEAESVREYDTDEPSETSPRCEEPEKPPEEASLTESDCLTEDNSLTEDNPLTEDNSSSKQESSHQNIRKIQRSELSVLPRKYWQLANNSFLLHGYHNYNHLILIEENGHYWLGVPGIYDPREAKAARLFGFPQFTDSYNNSLQLSDDECNPNEHFGYWCCYLK